MLARCSAQPSFQTDGRAGPSAMLGGDGSHPVWGWSVTVTGKADRVPIRCVFVLIAAAALWDGAESRSAGTPTSPPATEQPWLDARDLTLAERPSRLRSAERFRACAAAAAAAVTGHIGGAI